MNDPQEPALHSYKGAMIAMNQLRESDVCCLAYADDLWVMSELAWSKVR